MRTLLPIAALAAVLLTACPGDPAQRPPEAPDDGVQATGRLDGAQIAVSDGEPEVLYGDCDPADGRDLDLCMEAFTIDGAPFGIVIENPEVLAEGTTLTVRQRCTSEDCVEVELRVGTQRIPVQSGRLRVRAADGRFAATFTFREPGTDLSGRFNVRPPGTP